MCVPHGAMAGIDSGYVVKKEKKSIKRVSQEEFEKGDPDFVDERTSSYEPKEKKSSFFGSFFK